MSKLWIAIDATNLCHILFFGGVQDIAKNYAQRVRGLIETYQPERVFSCFDAARTHRHDIISDYKAGRPERPPEIGEAIQQVFEQCSQDSDNPAVMIDQMEADDLLCSFAAAAVRNEDKALLVVNDKDCFQCLIEGQVSILRKFGCSNEIITDPEFFTASDLKKKTGLRPSQWTDYQTLIGDGGDNIRGVDGIGPKTAVQILQQAERSNLDFQGILNEPTRFKIPKNRIDALVKFRKRADTVRQLVTLRNDLPVWDYMK